MACLMYQLVYGEGISTVILLWFTYEIVNNSFNSQKYFLLGGVFIGLLALTKSPLMLTFLPFLAVFLIKHKKNYSWQSVGNVVIIALIPSLVWALYVNIFHISHYKPNLSFGEMAERLSAPNSHFLYLAFKDIWMNAKNFVFLIIYSLVLFILFSKKYLEAVPALFLMIGVILYYAYYYTYGSVGDYGSFLRYIMPVSLPIFYLGGVGLSNLMESLENSKIAMGLKMALMIGFAGLFVYKIF
jgi:4-amino-4-deoxy-L-arabinose transferase-like glycosyltransferase